MARIIVTGDTGFIGRRLCTGLLKRGHAILGISDQDTNVPWVHQMMELRSNESLRDKVVSMKPDVLIHLAFIFGDEASKTGEAPRANEEMTRALLEALRGVSCGIVFASTCAVYGDGPDDCTPQSTPNPIGKYAQDKLATESILSEEARRSKRTLTILRLGNVYGPGDERSIIAKILHAANDGCPFIVFPEERIRDYVHINDVVSAFITAVEHQPSGAHILNVGTGHGVGVRELISTARDFTKKNVLMQEEDGPRDYVGRCVLDIRETVQILDWHPIVSLEDGICSLWAHLTGI